ncbi:MAG: preprotein translocase subunit SecG [Holosporaceae bacterium]|jgi:preprotein translocase subunit SecG|nr:preprotein translocase subunit SecG [Holosporaceae bacterium]
MLSFLLAIHFVLTLAIIGLVLLQKHDSDGALGSSGGGTASGMFSVRGQANLLTRSTAVLMAIFVLNCLVMAKIVKKMPAKESVIDSVARESNQQETKNLDNGDKRDSSAGVTPTERTVSNPGVQGMDEKKIAGGAGEHPPTLGDEKGSATTTPAPSVKPIQKIPTPGSIIPAKNTLQTSPARRPLTKGKK